MLNHVRGRRKRRKQQPACDTERSGEMHTITELVDRYIAVWNEPDDAVRRKHITELWAADGGTYHKLVDACGYDANVWLTCRNHK